MVDRQPGGQADGPTVGPPEPADDGEVWELRRPGGVSLRYLRSGPDDAEAPSILILDGIGCSGWAFRRIIPRLAERRRVVHLHYRGHGRSPDPPRPWRIRMTDFADDAAAACEHAGLGPVVVVGFSMGFQVALELFRRHRSRIVGLVSLAGPSGRVLRNFQGTQAFGQALPLGVVEHGVDPTHGLHQRLAQLLEALVVAAEQLAHRGRVEALVADRLGQVVAAGAPLLAMLAEGGEELVELLADHLLLIGHNL